MSVEVVASTVLGIETTIFAIAVAVYIMIRQSSEFTMIDRLLLLSLGPEFMMNELMERMTKEVVSYALLIYFTAVGYVPAVIAGVWGWFTDDMGAIIFSVIYFLISFVGFVYGATHMAGQRKAAEVSESKEL